MRTERILQNIRLFHQLIQESCKTGFNLHSYLDENKSIHEAKHDLLITYSLKTRDLTMLRRQAFSELTFWYK
ncbi:hypothetical protein CEXT_85161 [Caerostris extrusa]|uniref:Uncharacterized protein n=1 Tax=Caerostris extrusa TaxID=172846 RepID=A0AAV4TRT1_CAEEX|nr:hypothetical protein CEXT_85161 [Caerostris extrusa]